MGEIYDFSTLLLCPVFGEYFKDPIGAKFYDEKSAYEVSKKIYEEMKYFNEGGLVVTSNQCGIHNGPVVSMIKSDWSENQLGTSFEEIWERYGDEIINGDFGINRYDTEVLKEIFKN